MGFSFKFFGESSHREFNYKPRYYDPEKEERRRMFGDDDPEVSEGGDKSGDYVPGKYLRGSFTENNSLRRKASAADRAQKIIGMVGLLLFFVVLIYIARFYGMISL